jgi:hypothetical protein
MAEGVNVDPLGSCMIGARAFPDKFRGLVDIGLVAPTEMLLKGRGTESPKFIGLPLLQTWSGERMQLLVRLS